MVIKTHLILTLNSTSIGCLKQLGRLDSISVVGKAISTPTVDSNSTLAANMQRRHNRYLGDGRSHSCPHS
jgi:hypothetical protein